jgi:hypothetical protein
LKSSAELYQQFHVSAVRTPMTSDNAEERPLMPAVYVLLLCAGYVYVAFFFLFMFRTILFPEYFRR